MQINTERETWIDLTKCAAIWFVLWGHAITELMFHDLYNNSAYLFIYSFHMPLFMLLSGLFAAKSFNIPFSLLFAKKFKQLVIPALSFGLWWFVILLLTENGYNTIIGFIKHESAAYWFLKSLFICYLSTYLCWKCHKWKKFAAVLFLLIFLFIQHWNITCFKVGNMLPFFYLGIVIKKQKDWIINHTRSLFLFSVAIFASLFPYYSMEYEFATYFFKEWSVYSFFNYGYYIIIALSGSLMIISGCICIDQWLKKSLIVKNLTKIGSMTLGIYLWQKLTLELIFPYFVQVDLPLFLYNYIFTPIISVAFLYLCYYITILSKKNKVLNIIFWWGQG